MAHGPFISVYNILSQKWVTHFKFEEGDIVKFMKIQSKKDKREKTEFAVILESGSIYCTLYNQVFSKESYEIVQVIKSSMRTFFIEGKILKVTFD